MEIIKIRPATANDGQWVVALLKEGAKNQHFAPTVSLQAEALFKQILIAGHLQMLKLRNGVPAVCNIHGEILVAEIDTIPAAFLISLEDTDEVELHLAGTKKQFLRHGCFRALTQHQITAKTNHKIFARCYRQSTFAIDALQQQGFVVTKSGDPIELTFKP